MNISVQLQEIERLQTKDTTAFYRAGLFPSERRHLFLPLAPRPDDNIFFSASIVYILESISAWLPGPDQDVVQQIARAVRRNYPYYQNKHGFNTYNFWQTKPARHFPHGRLLSRFQHFKLPDEIDTTALIYLTSPHQPALMPWLKQKLALHTNGRQLQIQTTLPKYQHLQAYSTWFGEKMPIEFDVCVLCNLFVLLSRDPGPLNKHDRDTLTFIRGVIQDRDYFSAPYRISPSYPSASIILYHLARLLAQPGFTELHDLKSQLLADMEQQFGKTTHFLEKVLLNSSFLRLGEKSWYEVPANAAELLEATPFYWFTAGFLSVYGNPVLKRLAKYTFWHLKYSCPAFNRTLLLEHEVYRQRARMSL